MGDGGASISARGPGDNGLALCPQFPDVLGNGLAIGKEQPGQILVRQRSPLSIGFFGNALQNAFL